MALQQYKIAPGKHMPVDGITYHEGEVVELEDFAAQENRYNLTHADGTAVFPVDQSAPVVTSVENLRAHEKVSRLQAHHDLLEGQLKVVKDLLAAAKEQATVDQAAAAERSKTILENHEAEQARAKVTEAGTKPAEPAVAAVPPARPKVTVNPAPKAPVAE